MIANICFDNEKLLKMFVNGNIMENDRLVLQTGH